MRRLGQGQYKPGKGYHFSEGPYVEYIGVIPNEEREKLQEDLTTEINKIINDTPESDGQWRKICEYDEAKEVMGEVPEYIPEGNPVRVVRLLEEDTGCPCGGTHVHHVKDLVKVEVTRIQKKKKNTRVSYKVIDSE